MNTTLSITQSDMHLLQTLFAHDDSVSPLDVQEREALAEKLQRAVVLPDETASDAQVAGLNDLVTVEDLSSSPPEKFGFTLVLPHEANFEDDQISVLSPLGSAVFGSKAGAMVVMDSPAGRRKMRVLAVSKKAAIH